MKSNDDWVILSVILACALGIVVVILGALLIGKGKRVDFLEYQLKKNKIEYYEEK